MSWMSDRRVKLSETLSNGGGSRYLLAPVAALAALAITFNAVVYTATSAISVLMSDSWHFVATFLMPYYERGLSLHDLLAKRSASDHAVPVQKIVLLANARLFDLDARVEGLLGVFTAIFTIALLGLVMRAHRHTRAEDPWRWVAVSAITAVYLSMNVTVIFDWPLVSLYFIILLIVFVFFAAVAHALASGKYWFAAIAGFICLVCADDIGLLAFVSAVAMIGFACLRKQVSGSRALSTLAAVGIATIAGRTPYFLYGGSSPDVADLSVLDRLSAILALGVQGVAEAGIVIASAPVVHRTQLPATSGPALQVCVALVVLTLHAWFWASQWKMVRQTLLSRLAVAMMLFAYLLAGGILYGRLSEFGLDYLNSPRYVQFYGLGLIAIILQLFTIISTAQTRTGAWGSKGMLLGLFIGLVCLQAHYGKIAWRSAPSLAEYERKLALQVGEAADPRNVQPLQCYPHIVICQQPYVLRRDVLEFLQQQQLNVFSPRIQQLRRLYPSPASAPGGAIK